MLSKGLLCARALDNLWENAVNRLSADDKEQFDFSQDDKLNALETLQQAIAEQTQNRSKAQLVVFHRKGRKITLRQLFDKVVQCIDKFKQVGDIVVQYDPGHAALPWAAVRLVLQVAVSEQQINSDMLEGIEHISEVIARFAWIETLYLHASTALRKQLQDSILKLYIVVLEFLAKARRHFTMRGYQRLLKSIRLETRDVQAHMQKIANEEEKVNKLARLIDTQYQQEHAKVVEGGITSLLAKVDGLSQQISSLDLRSGDSQPLPSPKRDELLQWLDAASTHQDYLNAQEAREQGTCDWIVHCQETQDWLDSSVSPQAAKILWIHGKPGTGKTILSSRLTEHLLDTRSVSVAYFFCYYGNEEKCRYLAIVRSWILQFAKSNKIALDAAMDVFQDKENKKAEEFEVWKIFRRINERTPGCHYLVDGFDECGLDDGNVRHHSDLDAKRRFLRNLDDAISGTDARVVIVSRFDIELKKHMQVEPSHSTAATILRLEHEITRQDTAKDLWTFVENKTRAKLLGRDPSLIDQVIEDSVEKAEGMFLWVKLAHNRLSRTESPSNLRNIVKNLPIGLEQAYERDLDNIMKLEPQRRERAIEIFRWTLFSLRPLTVQQLLEALLISLDRGPRSETSSTGSESDSGGDTNSSASDTPDASDYFPRDLLPETRDRNFVEDEILKLCGSLIELRQADEDSEIDQHTVHFVHFSAHEYLKALSITSPLLGQYKLSDRGYSNDKIGQLCLRYLCYDDFIQRTNSTIEEFNEKLKRYAFLSYAGVYWGWHANERKQRSEAVIELCNELLDPSNSKWLSYSEVVGGRANGSYKNFISRFRDSYPSPLFYASLWGCVETMVFLLNKGENVNHVGGLYGSPLKAAAAHGHQAAIDILIENGAEVNAVGGQLGTALITACSHGHQHIVQTLLQHNADVHQTGGWSKQSPVLAASKVSDRKKSAAMLRQLIKVGAQTDDVDEGGMTALHHAAQRGDTKVVKLLVRHGADIDVEDEDGYTALATAIEAGKQHAAKSLVEAGADSNKRDSYGFTQVHVASVKGYTELLHAMLDRNADIEAEVDDNKMTSLHLAVEMRHIDAILLLLKYGAKADKRDFEGRTVLHYAALDDQCEIASLLLDHGADKVVTDQFDKTALQLALDKGKQRVAEILQSREAQNV